MDGFHKSASVMAAGPGHDERRARLRGAVVVTALTIVIGLPRFAQHTPDSPQYVELARYFRGDTERDRLAAPYAYRVLTPFFAAQLPMRDVSINLALINVLCTVLAYLTFARYLARLLPSRTDVNVGMLLLTVSFPTFAYSSRVLSDPAGFLALVTATILLLDECRWAFSVTLTLGTLARDSVILMVAVFLLHRAMEGISAPEKRHWLTPTLAILPPIVTFFAVRAYFSDLPDRTGAPSLHQLWRNLESPLRCASVLLTIGPPTLLLLAGWRRKGLSFAADLPAPEKRLLLVITALGLVFGLYSLGAFVVGGRYFWPAYPGLIPLAVMAGIHTTLFTRWLAPAANALFGT